MKQTEYRYFVKCQCGERMISGGIGVPHKDMSGKNCPVCFTLMEMVKEDSVEEEVEDA